MKTTKIFTPIILIFAVVYFLTGCGKKQDEVKDDKQKTEMKHEEHTTTDTSKMVKEGSYFCPMHPLQQSNGPAKCPICKMDLISKKDHNKEMMDKHEELEKKGEANSNLLHFEIKLSQLKSWECESAIKKALKNTTGVNEFFIDILDSRVHAVIDKSKTTKKDIEKVIADLGYDANDTKANPDAAAKLPNECK